MLELCFVLCWPIRVTWSEIRSKFKNLDLVETRKILQLGKEDGVPNDLELILQRELSFIFRYLWKLSYGNPAGKFGKLFQWPLTRRGRRYGIVLWVVNSSHPVLQTLLREFLSIPTMRVAGWKKLDFWPFSTYVIHRLLGVGVLGWCVGYSTVLMQYSKLYFDNFIRFRLWGLPDEKKLDFWPLSTYVHTKAY